MEILAIGLGLDRRIRGGPCHVHACALFKVARELNTSLDVAMVLDTLRSDGIKKILDGNTGAMMNKYAVLVLIS